MFCRLSANCRDLIFIEKIIIKIDEPERSKLVLLFIHLKDLGFHLFSGDNSLSPLRVDAFGFFWNRNALYAVDRFADLDSSFTLFEIYS